MLTDIGKEAYLLHRCLLGTTCQQTALSYQACDISIKNPYQKTLRFETTYCMLCLVGERGDGIGTK